MVRLGGGAGWPLQNRVVSSSLIPKESVWGVPTVAQQAKSLTSVHEDADSIPGLGQ